MSLLLAGDVGGTKTDLAVFSPEKGPRTPLVQKRFHSADYPGLAKMARQFLDEVQLPVRHACFDVAGPVVGGQAQLTNLTWSVDEQDLQRDLGLASVRLLNDLEAIANAVPHLKPDDLQTLSPGTPAPHGAIGVIAPGTGLGEAFLTWTGDGYEAHPSEGGHSDFGPNSELEIGLLQYLQKQFGHVSYERVCAGIGIPNIYDYLKAKGVAAECPDVAAELAGAEDRTPPIIRGALRENPCPLSVATLQLFVETLGAEAGNLALKVLATGGVYMSGGIPPRILPALGDGRFLAAFRRKGRFTELLTNVPVHVILNPVALIGAASYGLRRCQP